MKSQCTRPKLNLSCKLTAKIKDGASLFALAVLYENADIVSDFLRKEGYLDDGDAYSLGGALAALLHPVHERAVELDCATSTKEVSE